MEHLKENPELRRQLLSRFRRSGAHVNLLEALDGISWEQAGKDHKLLPYNIWQLAEHIRITQYDIIEFCRNPDYGSPEWPKGYWPEKTSPGSKIAWIGTLKQIRKDYEAFADLLSDPYMDLLKRFEHGDGQSFFNEALLIMDHNAYHTGQIILIRKLNGWWS